jgi:hypothetical protein
MAAMRLCGVLPPAALNEPCHVLNAVARGQVSARCAKEPGWLLLEPRPGAFAGAMRMRGGALPGRPGPEPLSGGQDVPENQFATAPLTQRDRPNRLAANLT